MSKCKKCKTKVKKGDLFCKTCGAKVEYSQTKELLMLIGVLACIFAVMWLISISVANLNLSWLYNGFQYPSIVIAFITIIYSFSYALKGQSEQGNESDDMVFLKWVANKGKKYGKLEDVVIDRIDGDMIGLGLYEASKKGIVTYNNDSIEIGNLEIPNYSIGLLKFMKSESVSDKESLNNSLEKRLAMRSSRYKGKYDSEVNGFCSSLIKTLQDETIINPNIKKAQYIIRGVAIFMLIFGFASLIRMEVKPSVVGTYALEGSILLFISSYIFGLGSLGREIKRSIKDYKKLIKDPKSLIIEKNNFNDALATAVALNKRNKFMSKINKFIEDDYLALNISISEVSRSLEEMDFYLSVGNVLYSNSRIGNEPAYIEEGEDVE